MKPHHQYVNEAVISSWDGSSGLCADGRPVRLSGSCLVQPEAGDQVLVVNLDDANKQGAIIAILERPNETLGVKLATGANLYISAPDINIRTKHLQSNSTDLLSHTVNRHIVEETRTLNAKIRVVELEMDQRIAKNVEYAVRGALWQRFGSWISNTATEARLKASSFIYDKYSK